MNKILSILFLFSLFSVKGQDANVAICMSKTTYIIFSNQIKEYNVGTREVQVHTHLISSNVLSMQAKPGVTDKNYIKTNLFVLLNDGTIYYFDVVLNDTLSSYMYNYSQTVIDGAQSIVLLPTEAKKDTTPEYSEYYAAMEKINDMFVNATNTIQGVTYSIQAVGYKDGLLFFKFMLKNSTGIDFDIEYIKFMKQLKKKKNRQSIQEVELPILGHQKYSSKLEKGQSQVFIFVLEKITLGKNEEMVIDIKESRGERNFNEIIPAFFITDAKKL
ncbi:MAG: conjugative transposon protein TraN [Tannerella sp.]|nr:conjugative transposon protein TraN [Tannerella sp.]